MPFGATAYRVLIASPGDVDPERDIVEAAIIDWDDEHSRERSALFLPVRWERASPRGGASGQEVVNEDLVDTSDVLIGVFWSRVGSRTKSERSGSIEEVKRFADSGKPFGLFFKDAPLSMTHDREQWTALLEFKQEVHSFEGDLRGLTQDFRADDELRRYIGRFLTDTLRRLQSGQNDGNSTSGGSVRTRLGQGLLQILSAATLLALEQDEPCTLVVLDKQTNPDLSNMSEARFRELIDELLRRGLIEVERDQGTAGFNLELTTEGLDQGLQAVTPNFDRAASRIKREVCAQSPTSVEELSTGLELPALLVYHVARGFADEGLLKVDRYSDQIKISRPTTALCGWQDIRRRKACLVIGPHFPNQGDLQRQHFEVDLLNEGDFEAREIRAMWDTGNGFPPEEQVAPMPWVIPPHTSGPESRYHVGFAVPWPAHNEDGEPIQGQHHEVRLKLTFRDGLDERDEAFFTLRLRNAPDPKRWNAEELREKARLAPICQGSRMESR